MYYIIIKKSTNQKFHFLFYNEKEVLVITSVDFEEKNDCVYNAETFKEALSQGKEFNYNNLQNNSYQISLPNGQIIFKSGEYANANNRNDGWLKVKNEFTETKGQNISVLITGQSLRKDLRDERAHMEGLLNQRFNFFIIIFGFITAAMPLIKMPRQLILILILGFFIELLLNYLIGRAQTKLAINMRLLRLIGKDPSAIIDDVANEGKNWNPFKYNRSAVNIMGYILPWVLTGILFLAVILSVSIPMKFISFFSPTESNMCNSSCQWFEYFHCYPF
jgi:hypothetical protein